MLDQGWSDGLPVIPPTAKRVRAMLDYAHRDASELVGYINSPNKVSEYGEIAKVLQHYINGAKSGRGDDMKPAFHNCDGDMGCRTRA